MRYEWKTWVDFKWESNVVPNNSKLKPTLEKLSVYWKFQPISTKYICNNEYLASNALGTNLYFLHFQKNQVLIKKPAIFILSFLSIQMCCHLLLKSSTTYVVSSKRSISAVVWGRYAKKEGTRTHAVRPSVTGFLPSNRHLLTFSK